MSTPRSRDTRVVAALGKRLSAADASTLNNFAWFAARQGDLRAALDAARTAIAMPNAPHAAWRTLERLTAGHTDGIVLAAGRDHPETMSAGNPLAAAIAAHQHLELAVAEACYRAALDRAALASAAWNGLAVLHEQRRERSAADQAWDRASDAGNVAAIHNRALAMLRRGFPHRARTSLAAWLQRHEPQFPLLFLAGYAALVDQDPAAALPLLSRAIESDPESARAQFTYGLACERLNLHVDALTAIRRALLLSPWYAPQTWLLDRGDDTALVELPVDVDDAGQGHTDDVLLSLGRSLLQTSHLGEALAVFDQVLVRQPAQAAALFHRGVVLAKLRRYGEALEDWEVLDRSDPGSNLADASRRHARSARQLATLFATR